MSAGEPFVGPGKDEGARDPGGKGGADLPGQRPGLLLLAGAQRIDAELGQHQRLVDSQIVQPGDVAAKRGLVVEVDVEAQEIGEIDRQIFGRGEIGVAARAPGVFGFDQLNQALKKTGSAPCQRTMSGGISFPTR